MASAPRPLQVDALEQQQWVIAQLPNGNGRNPYWSFARKSSVAEIAITLGRFRTLASHSALPLTLW